jgi:clathrin heavy chain
VSNNFKITRKPNKADAAIMNPSENIIALRAKNVAGTGQVLQVLKFSLNQKIFDMEKKNKLVNLDFPDPIVYWRWANADKLAVVTQNSVYHINIRNQPD